MHSVFAIAFLAFAGFSASQSSQQQSYPYTIDPQTVSSSDRQTWCNNQKAQCPLICLQQPGVTSMTTVKNDCDPDALTYSCICENNVSPNITQYSQTLPYYICTEWGNQCVANCHGDNSCANACRADHPCGAQHPNPPNSSIPTTMSATATTSQTKVPVTGLGGSAATTAAGKTGGAGAAFGLGQSYSLVVVFVGLFAGFALLM